MPQGYQLWMLNLFCDVGCLISCLDKQARGKDLNSTGLPHIKPVQGVTSFGPQRQNDVFPSERDGYHQVVQNDFKHDLNKSLAFCNISFVWEQVVVCMCTYIPLVFYTDDVVEIFATTLVTRKAVLLHTWWSMVTATWSMMAWDSASNTVHGSYDFYCETDVACRCHSSWMLQKPRIFSNPASLLKFEKFTAVM